MKVAKCSHCGAKFDVSKLAAGVKIRCGRCKEIFTVPDLSDALTAAMSRPASAAAAKAPAAAAAPKAAPKSAPAAEERPATKTAARPDRGTSVRNRPAAAEQEAGGRGTAVRVRAGTRTAEEEPPSKAGRRSVSGQRGVAPKKNQGLILAAGGGGLLILALVVFLLVGKGPGTGGGSGDNPTAGGGTGGTGGTPYDAIKAKTNMGDCESLVQLAYWCDQNGMPEKRDEHLEAAYKINASNETLKALISQVYTASIQALAADDAKGRWSMVCFLDKFGMKNEADKLTSAILKINKNHPESNKRFDRVLFEGKWEDRDLVEDVMSMRKSHSDENELLASMTPRQREVHKAVQAAKKMSLEFEYLDLGSDQMPYLIFVQKSNRYAAESALSEFGEVLGHLYKLFYAQYGEKFDISDLKEEVMVVWVYDSKETYMTQGGPAIARGHYSPMDHQVKTYNEPDGRYEVIFHEGVHQLVHRITLTKGGKDGNMFWFTEGLATYFETFKRDKNLNFLLGEVASGSWLPNIKAAIRAKAHVPLETFVSWIYAQAMAQPPQTIGGLLYPEAWSFVYFLYKYDGGKYRGKFEDYFKAECLGQGGPEKFKEIFGDVNQLDGEWQAFITSLK